MKFQTLQPSKSLALVILLTFSFVCSSPAQSKKTKPVKGYGEATYTLSSAEQYMSAWLVAGPVAMDNSNPDEPSQINFFKEEPTPVTVTGNKPIGPLDIKGKQYPWTIVKAVDGIVDLDKQYAGADFVAAYALAEIRSDKEVKTFLGVGSDDGIRIWHNGKLIHDNWIPRGVAKDQDMVPITLTPGSNQILLKVQDMRQGWGFTARVLGKQALSENLVTAAGRGDLDQIKLLVDAGADLTKTNASGLTALNQANLAGREEVAQLLLSRGAKETPMPSPEVMVNGIYNFLNGKSASGVSVLIAKDGKVIYKKGFGYADIDKNQLVGSETKFRIGSITKQFTAAAILKLQEEGKVSVTDKLSKFYPDFPRADEVTIHQLLTHISGIHSYTGKPEFITRVTSPISEEELIAFFKNDPYDFNPGERWEYNNSAYFLLGTIVSKISGKPFADYLKQTFFDPIGMTSTGIYKADLGLANEARGYTKENQEYKPAMNWDMSWAGGAGALYSTVEDLYKWNEALFNGKVLKDESMKAAFTPVVLNNGEKPSTATYGYGWAIDNYRGQDAIGHSGGLHGFISQLTRFTKENLTVVILTNLTPPEVMMNPNTLAETVLWEKMEKQKANVINTSIAEDVNQYTGRYDFPGIGVMTITAEGKNLFAQLSGQPRFPIFPSAEGEYFWKVVDAKVRFVKNATGEVEYGDFEQNGNKIKVVKLKENPIATIDKAFYKLYSGKYDFGNNFIITISSENDKLYAQGTNQPKFEIVPLSETEFEARDVNARLIFIKESDGKISKFILDQGGQKRDVVRMVD